MTTIIIEDDTAICNDCGAQVEFEVHANWCEIYADQMQDYADEAWEREEER